MTPVLGSFGDTASLPLAVWVDIAFPRETGQDMSRALKLSNEVILRE